MINVFEDFAGSGINLETPAIYRWIQRSETDNKTAFWPCTSLMLFVSSR